ncbi:MAG: 50S ribosomal protein L22 [Balneolales bacterium]
MDKTVELVEIEAKATQKHLRISARKARLVVDLVRGENVEKALNRLAYTEKAAAPFVAKVIKSAAANLRDRNEEEDLDNEDLFVKAIFVDEGVTLKRIQPAPMGRAHPIRKRTSHITAIVAREEIKEQDLHEDEEV